MPTRVSIKGTVCVLAVLHIAVVPTRMMMERGVGVTQHLEFGGSNVWNMGDWGLKSGIREIMINEE